MGLPDEFLIYFVLKLIISKEKNFYLCKLFSEIFFFTNRHFHNVDLICRHLTMKRNTFDVFFYPTIIVSFSIEELQSNKTMIFDIHAFNKKKL